jgi:hypothetical protein
MAAAYVASARIDRGRPRLAADVGSRIVAAAPRLPAMTDGLLDTTPPEKRALELRWEAVCERWSQLWFFVLDTESWR